MILLIDNYDSFTYNLYQQVSSLGEEVRVFKHDQISLEQVHTLDPRKIILSPGPKTPHNTGICITLIKASYKSIPILGVCLGHQCLATAFGQKVVAAQKLVFGKTTPVTRTRSRILSGLPDRFEAARYHALVINQAPAGFDVTSTDEQGDIMSIEHRSLPLFGLQFHPESFLMQESGDIIIRNFLEL